LRSQSSTAGSITSITTRSKSLVTVGSTPV
jgi:hypothetical protein